MESIEVKYSKIKDDNFCPTLKDMIEELVNIQLTPPEAELFLKFRKHQDFFETLIKNGVPEARNAKAILTFSNDAYLMNVTITTEVYKRKRVGP